MSKARTVFQTTVASLALCLIAGCSSLEGARNGEQVEQRVAQLQRTVQTIPLVHSWPVTPMPEGIKSLYLEDGWVYAQGRSNAVYGMTVERGLLEFAYSGIDAPLDMPPVNNSTASYFASGNELTAISHVTGRPMWKADLEAALTSEGSVSETHFYAGTFRRTLQSYNLADGRPDWFWRVGDSYVSARATYHEPRVFFASESGTVFSLDGGSGQGGSSGGILLECKDAVLGDIYVNRDNIYVASHDQNLYCVDRLSGKIRWQFTAKVPLSRGAMSDDGVCYVRSDDGVMHAVSEASGEELWNIPSIERFIVTVDGDAYLLRGARTLLRIDAETGEQLGSVRLDSFPFVPSNPEGEQLVLGSRDGYVFALRPLALDY